MIEHLCSHKGPEFSVSQQFGVAESHRTLHRLLSTFVQESAVMCVNAGSNIVTFFCFRIQARRLD